MNDPQGFLKFKREEIPLRPPSVRRQDWEDIQLPLADSFLHDQGARCMDCGVPFCQGPTGCPVDNLIPEWNSLVSQGQWKKAVERLHATNNFPEWTGRLCPAPCEGACVLENHSKPVNIKSIEQGIIERAFQKGWVAPHLAPHRTGKKIAVIGSGPAGLAAAQQLVRQGHDVVVFEKEDKVGGLLRYGIPDFKLPKHLIDRRLAQLEAEGVIFQTSTCFGKDISYSDLKREFDAIALALGAEKARDLKIPGRELSGIHLAMDYLVEQNRRHNLESAGKPLTARGKKVVILGGGDTGSDCLGTALRQGASQVLQFEIQSKPSENRTPQNPWPYWPIKLKSSHAHQEGGERHWSLATESFLGAAGKVTALKARKIPLASPSANTSAGSTDECIFESDMVILAMGFEGARTEYLSSIPGLKITAQGQIETDSEFRTGAKQVYACGDVRRGASLIVWAIAEGRRMAAAIHQHLGCS